MKFPERVSMVLFVIGFTMCASQIQGGTIILVTALAALGVLYFPLGFYTFKKESNVKTIILSSLIFGLILLTLVFGVFLRLMILPGGEAWQIICAPFWLIALGTLIYMTIKRTGQKIYYRSVLIKTIFLFVLNVLLYLVPTETMIDLFNGKNTPASEQMKDAYHRQKEAEGYY